MPTRRQPIRLWGWMQALGWIARAACAAVRPAGFPSWLRSWLRRCTKLVLLGRLLGRRSCLHFWTHSTKFLFRASPSEFSILFNIVGFSSLGYIAKANCAASTATVRQKTVWPAALPRSRQSPLPIETRPDRVASLLSSHPQYCGRAATQMTSLSLVLL